MNRTLRLAFILLVLFIFSPNSFLFSENQPAVRIITYPGETCKTPPLTKWSEQEKWVWKQLCEGKPANLARHYGGSTNLKDFKSWQKKQKLSQEFLETILLYDPFLSELKNKRVEIIGAWFEKPLLLTNINLYNDIFLHGSRFDQRVSLYNLKSNHILSLDGSGFGNYLSLKAVQLKYLSLLNGKFKGVNLHAAKIEDIAMNGSEFLGELNMNSIEVGESLHMRNKAKFKNVNLAFAKISGIVEMEGSEFLGELNMNSIKVGKNIYMAEGSKFEKVRLSGAHIGGQIEMSGSEFLGELNMTSTEVDSNLRMTDGAKFNKVILPDAHISGQIVMDGSEFLGELNMESIEVGESLHMRNKAKFNKVNLAFAKISGQVEMENSQFLGELNMNSIDIGRNLLMNDKAKFNKVDLTRAKIGDQLNMDSAEFLEGLDMKSIEVGEDLFMRDGAKFNAKVILTFSKIRSNFDISNSSFVILKLTGTDIHGELRFGQKKSNDIWPEKLDIKGLSFSEIINKNSKLSIQDLKGFLEKQTPYNPQPYEYLASVLRNNGQFSIAKQILFEKKERERSEADFPKNLGMFFSRWWIGYGIGCGYFYICFWIVFFVGVGVWILHKYGDNKNHDIRLGIFYSIDMLLPIIRLREKHYNIDLSGPATNYFYFHKVLGYVMATFLVAGLSGLTQ